MRPLIAALFCSFVALAAPSARAEGQARPALPATGERVSVDASVYTSGLSLELIRTTVRNGDPESERFEQPCTPSSPMTAVVLGSVDDAIVVRYATSAGMYAGTCPNGGVVLLDLAAWNALKRVEARLARQRADRERRREAVRAILRSRARR